MAAVVGEWGRIFVSMALLLFVFTTLVYNYYLGENALGFFTSKRQARRAVAAYMADHPECYSYVVLTQAGGLYDKLAARLQEEVRS